jgi:hypothetical protein
MGPACGFVLGELRPVQIKSDEDAAFSRVGQRLDDSRVRQNVRRHVDRQFGAANLPSVKALKVFARRIMDLRLGSLGLPLDLGPLLRPSRSECGKATQALRNKRIAKADSTGLNSYNSIVVFGCKCK